MGTVQNDRFGAFYQHLIPFELAAIMLLVAMIAGIVLASKRMDEHLEQRESKVRLKMQRREDDYVTTLPCALCILFHRLVGVMKRTNLLMLFSPPKYTTQYLLMLFFSTEILLNAVNVGFGCCLTLLW